MMAWADHGLTVDITISSLPMLCHKHTTAGESVGTKSGTRSKVARRPIALPDNALCSTRFRDPFHPVR